MILEVTPARAQEIRYMMTDWNQPFSIKDPEYIKTYTNAVKDLLDIFDITMEDIEEILK